MYSAGAGMHYAAGAVKHIFRAIYTIAAKNYVQSITEMLY